MRELGTFIDEALPALDPVRAHHRTSYGWRGLTEVGEVLEVRGNGEVPREILMAFNGTPIGRREIRNDWHVDIDSYLKHFNLVVSHYKANRVEQALHECDLTLVEAPTVRAKFNRSMLLLAAGRWREGLAEYCRCEDHAPFMRPQVRESLDFGLTPWHGEALNGRRLLVLHAHGFGDTLMMLRYLPVLRGAGIKVAMLMPSQLERLAAPKAPIIREVGEIGATDVFCPILHLLQYLHVTPEGVGGRPYLSVDATLVAKWLERLGPKTKKRIGIAWSVGKPSDGDYPREIPAFELVNALGDVEIHSVQTQSDEESRWLGIAAHDFEDFADCAALMMCMDEIASIDTAALHLAGAIGHPRVFGLLSHWASWRWLARWYDNVKLCRQTASGDWSSALAQMYAS